MTLHHLVLTLFTSSLSQLFKLKHGLRVTPQLLKTLAIILEEVLVVSKLKTLPNAQALAHRCTTPKHQTITPMETNGHT